MNSSDEIEKINAITSGNVDVSSNISDGKIIVKVTIKAEKKFSINIVANPESQTEEYIEHQRQVSQTGRFRFHTIQMTAFFRAFASLYAKNRPHSRENRFFDVY